MDLRSSLTAELKDKEYRAGFVASQIRIGLPFQIRGLRRDRKMNQGELAARVGMAQPRISEIEKPGERSLNIDTLLRIASGLDVGLQIRFVPFSELVDWSERFQPDKFHVHDFETEIAALEKEEVAHVASETSSGMLAIEYMPPGGGSHASTKTYLDLINKPFVNYEVQGLAGYFIPRIGPKKAAGSATRALTSENESKPALGIPTSGAASRIIPIDRDRLGADKPAA